MAPRFTLSGPERANGVRIAVTLGVIALAVALLLWGGSALLGRLFSQPPVESPTSALPAATSTAEPTASAEATEPAATTTQPLPKVAAVPAPASAPRPSAPAGSLGVVVIDAGHQGKGDPKLEPVGPGASEKKARVTSGTSGVVTRRAESEVTLEVALKLRDELQARGATVVMVRTRQDVNISNSERAKVGNDANADLVVRLHCDGAEDRARTGLSTLVPGRNRWTGPIVAQSGIAGRFVHDAVIATTGAKDRGVVQRADLSGFNWSTRPSVLVEMGFMSNANEDRNLSSGPYQAKLVDGIADGVEAYLQAR